MTHPPIDLADLTLHRVLESDRAEVIAAYARTADRLEGDRRPMDDEHFTEFVAKADTEHVQRRLARHRGELVAIVNLQQIVRGDGQFANLGYLGFTPHQGRGLVRRAVALLLDEAFGELELHRVDAGIRADNGPSLRLVESLGFTFEGVMRGLIRSDGQWHDHQLWALLEDEWPGAEALFGR